MATDPPPASRLAANDTDQRLHLLLDSLSEHAVFLIDLSGVIESWNSGVRRVLGYEEKEFCGLPFATLFTPEDRAQGKPEEELERALATGRSDDNREHVRKDGSRFHADGIVTVMRGPDGAPIAFCKVMHDVTAKRAATEALRISEQQYRSLVDSVSDHAIFMLDVRGHVASWTPTCRSLLGYTSEQIVGQHFRVFFTTEDQQHGIPEQELRMADQAGRAQSEGWRVRIDGSRFWAEEIVSPIRGTSGELQGFAKVVRDLTERQRVALEREQLYAQAQEANRLKDDFLGTVSHELRTPLNAILGWTQLLESGAIGNDEVRRQRALATIRRNARMQAKLIDDLLDVSRIISGKMRLDIRPTAVRHILSNVVESLQPTAEAKEITLELTHLDDRTVAADAERMQQVVWNLVSNAIKFTPTGGHVCVEARATNRGVDIVVEDTGQGITPDVLPFVFDRFRQADSSTRRSHGGVGLGLAIARHLVELHGGTIDAASRGTGRGATFTVHLPAGRVPEHRPAVARGGMKHPRAIELPSLPEGHVLLVDDDPETREVLTAFFERAGARVVTAESAASGIVLLEQRMPDVIIADIGMPREDGYAFIADVRRRHGAAERVPAIALTAYARREDQERAIAAGFQKHIAKPADPVDVVAAAAELIRGARS